MKDKIIEILNQNSGYIDRSRTEKAIHEDNFDYLANKLLEAINYSRCCMGKAEQLCDKCERENQLQILSKQAQDLNLGYND